VEFSPVGLVVSVAVLAPNLLLAVYPPRVPMPTVRVPLLLAGLERAGQASCLVIPVIVPPGPFVAAWSAVAAACLAGYYAL
jgi:hypothetical protein